MFLHTFYTWILANILHPVMFFLATFVMGEASGLNQNLFESYFLYLIYSFFISIPCLFLGWLSLFVILVTPNTDDAKFVLWLVTAPALIIFEFLVILVLLDSIDMEVLLFSLPGIVATGVSVLVRYQQFRKLIHTPKIENHETNMV
jgi:hypothetical protein